MAGFFARVGPLSAVVVALAGACTGSPALKLSTPEADAATSGTGAPGTDASPAASDVTLLPFLTPRARDSRDTWDTCVWCMPLVRAPEECGAACPATTSGADYVRWAPGTQPSTCEPTRFPRTDAQIYSWFHPPIPAGTARALWFDVTAIAGDNRDATVSIYATGSSCETQQTFGTWRLGALLTGTDGWQTSCVTLRPTAETSGIGFTFTGGCDFGFSAPRLGPPCPS